MKLSQFKFKLPEEQIALFPHSSYYEETDENGQKTTLRLTRRDESRLMVLHRKSKTIDMLKKDKKGKEIKDSYIQFRDVLDYFDEDDTFILNDTKVFPGRLYGTKEKTDAKIEVFLLRELNREMRLWDVLVEPARKIRIGNKLFFDEGNIVAEVIDNTTSRGRTLRFLFSGSHEEFREKLFSLGKMPLPEQILELRGVEPSDEHDYQTIYAEKEGAIISPSAGLHFTKEMLNDIKQKGVNIGYVTLHVGLGTFRPVKVEDVTKHVMHSEHYRLSKETADLINETKKKGKRIISVGTTSTRTLESIATKNGCICEDEGDTSIFIYPGYEFKCIDALITNFHLPESTLIMLVSAFAGYDKVTNAYKTAVKEKYRFFSFGDAMLIV